MATDFTDLFHGLEREPRRFAWVWWGYLILYAIAIPWYWPAGYRGTLILGLPTWVAVTLTAVVGLALWTSLVIHRCWIDGSDSADFAAAARTGGTDE